MVTPELKWPTTNFTPSPTNLLATDTPSRGSARSSPMKSWIFCPRMPPWALMSATACSAPCLKLGAEGGVAAGHRAADAHPDLRRSGAGEHKAQAQREAQRQWLLHDRLPLRNSVRPQRFYPAVIDPG